MKMLTKNCEKKEIEQMALNLIMRQKDMFTVKTIILSLRSICHEEISNDVIEEIVFNAFEVCISERLIDYIDKYTYMVDPAVKFEYDNKFKEVLI